MEKYFTLFILGVTFVLLSANPVLSQNNPPFSIKPLGSNSNMTLEFLNDFISSQMEQNHISGLAASIVVGDSIVWCSEFGLANREDDTEVTDSTLFLAYSVSKMFTGLSLMQQYDKGLFNLDDDINDYLPFDVVHPQYPDAIITFRMLMNHTAGITEPWSLTSSLMTEGYDSPISLSYFMENFFISGGEYYSTSHFSNYEPGTNFFYSNVGATLAGYLTEVISGIPFNEYCKDSLLIPMGMDNSSFLLADINMDNLARPYEYSGSNYIPLGHISNATLPAGFLRSSNRQMANFVKTLVNNGNFEGTQIIQESTLDTMTTNIGLLMGYDPNYDAWGHTGGLSGLKTAVLYHKEEKWGLSLLTNGDVDNIDLFYHIVYILADYAKEFSALSLSSFTIDDENNNEIIEPNEDFDLIIGFRNSYQRTVQNGKVVLRCADENITVTDSVFSIASVNTDDIITNQDNPFKILASNFLNFQEVVLELHYYENNVWIGKEKYPIYLGHTPVLLIDDEEHPIRNRSKSGEYYKDALNSLDTLFLFRNLTLSPINQSFINQFKKVIWYTGLSNQNSNILPDEEQSILTHYLDQGGQLFLSSQNAGDFCGNTSFFTDYLKVNHIDDSWSGSAYVTGQDNDTIGNGLHFYISGGDGNNCAISPSVIEAVNEGIPVFQYGNTSNLCGVRYQDEYKSVFISFGIEAINNADDRKEILNRTLRWFEDATVDIPEKQPLTGGLNSLYIFPNPTHGNINIKLPPNTVGLTNIYITDSFGKIVIENQINTSNNELYYFENLKLSPGLYFVNLFTREKNYSQKLFVH